MLLSQYLAALALTVLVETGVALVFLHRARWTASRGLVIWAVVLVNLITHPALTYVVWLNAWMKWMPYPIAVTIVEISAVFIEWRLLAFALGDPPPRCFCSLSP